MIHPCHPGTRTRMSFAGSALVLIQLLVRLGVILGSVLGVIFAHVGALVGQSWSQDRLRTVLTSKK